MALRADDPDPYPVCACHGVLFVYVCVDVHVWVCMCATVCVCYCACGGMGASFAPLRYGTGNLIIKNDEVRGESCRGRLPRVML